MGTSDSIRLEYVVSRGMVSGCSKLLKRSCLVRRGAIVNLYGPTDSRSSKKIVIATCVAALEALNAARLMAHHRWGRPMTLSRYITVGNNPPLFHDTILGEIALVMAAQEIILHLEREAFIGANEELA